MVASTLTKIIVVVSANLVALFVALLFKANGDGGEDPLNQCIAFKNGYLGKNCMSWWPITHFILYFLIALIFPEDWLGWWYAGGFFWEFLEYSAGSIMGVAPGGSSGGEAGGTSIDKSDQEYTKWMEGSPLDPVWNGAGMLLGWLLRKYVFRY